MRASTNKLGTVPILSDENGTVPLAKVEVIVGRPLCLRRGDRRQHPQADRPVADACDKDAGAACPCNSR